MLYTFKIIILVLLMHPVFMAQGAKKQYHMFIELKGFTCTSYTKNFSFFLCEYERLAENTYGLSVIGKESVYIPTDLIIRSQLFIQLKNAKTKILFWDIEFNACDAFKTLSENPIFKSLKDGVKSRSNLPLSCPYKANFLYKIDKLIITENFVPKYLPDLNYTITLDIHQAKKPYIGFQAQGITGRR